jgi:chromosome segregation ATPase
MKENIVRLNVENAELKKNLQLRENKIKDLEVQLTSEKSRYEEEISGLRDTIQSSKRLNESSLHELESCQKSFRELEQRFQILMQDLSDKDAELQEIRYSHDSTNVETIEKRLFELEEENIILKSTNDERQKILGAREQELTDLRKKINELARLNETLARETQCVHDLEEQLIDSRLKYAHAQNEIEELRMIQPVANQLPDELNVRNLYEEQKNELKYLKEQLNNELNTSDMLTKEINVLKNEIVDLNEYKYKCAQMESELHEKSASAQKIKKSSSETAKSVSEEFNSLKENYEAARKKIETLSENLIMKVI